MSNSIVWLRAHVFLAAFFISAGVANADVVIVPSESLTMNDELREDVRQTLRYVHYGHYRPNTLNDEFSSRTLDAYLEALDPYKVYFTQADVDAFEPYRNQLDDLLKRSNAEAAFVIFKQYRDKVDAQTELALELIDSDFDFSKQESINIEKDDITWATSQEELKERWRKKIKNDTIVQIMSATKEDEIKSNLRKRYTRQRDVVNQFKADEVFEFFMNAYASELEPHTQYMSHMTAERFRINMSLSLEGIGAVLQAEDDYTKILRTIPGGPAEESGEIEADDKIVAVGQKGEEKINVIGWRLNDVVKMIRGDKGTEVILDVIKHDDAPGSPPKTITLVRDVIKLEEQAAKLSEVNVLDEKGVEQTVSVIRIPSFYSNLGMQNGQELTATTHDVRKLLKEVKATNSAGLVIDLRGNGGGFLNEAIGLTGLFIDKGPVVQVVQSNRKRHVYKDEESGVAYTGPLVVLIDRYSASAAEIFAGAMQDYGRALVVGERSFGKGTVQQVAPLRHGKSAPDHMSQLKFTNAQFFRINGDSTQHAGITPDIVLKAGELDENFGERSYDNTLPWARTQRAEYQAGVLPAPMILRLLEKHQQRAVQSPAFDFLRKTTQRIQENKDIKTLSLSLENRKSESERLKQASLDDLNRYRVSLGLEEVTEETKKDNPLPDKDEHWNIVFQKEAAQILVDLLDWQARLPANQLTNSGF